MDYTKTRSDGSRVNDGINNNTYDLLFKDYPKLPENEWGSRENAIAFGTINRYTLHEKRNLLVRLQDKLDKLAGFDIKDISYNEDTKSYHYKKDNDDIPFNKLSDFIDGKKAKKDLHSNKRFGYCHTHSCGLAYSIEDAYVVTGYLKIRWTKVLHSIVEFNHNNETYILDWTRNVRMLKSDYYKMTDFEEVARFKADSVEDDMSYAGPLKLGSKVYVTFRDEIISDLEKNKTLFRK